MKRYSLRKSLEVGGRHTFILFIFFLLMNPVPVKGDDEPGAMGVSFFSEWYQRNWAVAFGGEEADEIFSLGMAGEDGIMLAGESWSFNSNLSHSDAWLMKLGPEGEILWEEITGDLYWDAILDLEPLPDGGFAAAGDRNPPGGSQEAWAMKLTSDGVIEWQKTYGRPDHYDSAWSIRAAPDGGFLLLGRTQSHAIGGEQGAWVLKLTAGGEIEWQKFLGGEEYDMLFSVDRTADGGYVLAGGTYSYSNVPLFSDVWLVKMAANGEIEWEKTYGGMYDDVAYAVRQSSDGGYVLASWTSLNRGDIWVLKTDSHGGLEWQKRFGGTGEDVPNALTLTRDGGLLIAGYTSSFGQGLYDGWILKLSGEGSIEWQKTFGGSERDAFNDVVETPLGYAAAGYTESFRSGERDGWCVHFTVRGPETLLIRSLTGPSHAVSSSTEAEEALINSYWQDTATSPTVSVTDTSESFSTVTDLSESPGRGIPFLEMVESHTASEDLPWPVVPGNRGRK